MSYSDNYDNISKENNVAGNAKAAQYSQQQQSARTVPKTPPTQGMFTPGTNPIVPDVNDQNQTPNNTVSPTVTPGGMGT